MRLGCSALPRHCAMRSLRQWTTPPGVRLGSKAAQSPFTRRFRIWRWDQRSYMQLQPRTDATDAEMLATTVIMASVTRRQNLRMPRPFRKRIAVTGGILGVGRDPRLSLRCRLVSASVGLHPTGALLVDAPISSFRKGDLKTALTLGIRQRFLHFGAIWQEASRAALDDRAREAVPIGVGTFACGHNI